MAEQLTVRELIEKLNECNPSALVELEGCDCYGDAIDVEPDMGRKTPTVLILRNN
jgi:hypothetical protein